jgi:hypothetical protein
MLSAREIEQRLEALLGDIGTAPRDAPERHRTLRATIDWSHALLDADEKACFARFSLFAGGATVHAAETVTQARLHTLEGLVAKSMLVRRRGSGAPTRLRMLETIRTYAGERLTREADVAAVRDRYLEFYLGLARRHGGERALWAPGAGEHLAALDADVANLHAALEWAIASGDAGRALTFCDALGCYWQMRGRYADAVDVVGRALDLPEARAYPVLRVRALRVRNAGLWLVGRASEQRATLAEAESVARTVGDPSVLSRVLQDRVDHEATRDAPLAARIAEEAVTLARSAGDDWVIAQAYRARAGVAPTIDKLRSRVEHAASLLTGVGNVYEVCKLLGSAAYAALWEQRDRDAKQFAQAALIAARAVDDAFTWLFVQGNFGLPALLTGDTDAARHAFREELRLCGELVARPFATEALRGLAGVACVDGDLERAARLAGAATALRCGQEDPVDARIQSLFFDAARARVGTRAWDAAAREGAALSFVAAVAYGLQEETATTPPRGTA